MNEEKTYYSIKQINDFIKEIFDNVPYLKNISLKGEISNFKGANKSGHLYFTLKDKDSSINAVIFKYDSFALKFTPKNGDEVIATGSISSYPPSGTYQIIIKEMALFGEGQLLLQKKILTQKLFQEGLFDESHKLPIPSFPEKIAIITGKNSAAATDFKYNINRRFPLASVQIFHSLVQGKEAHLDLIKNLKEAELTNPDLIIIGRGGGASEDLSAFDEEELVRTIYDLKIPVISAIGHEINKSLCDLVADAYASTPTGAAEIAVPDYQEILYDLNQQSYYLKSLINSKITRLIQKVESYEKNKYIANVENLYEKYSLKIDHCKDRIKTITCNNLISKEKQLTFLSEKINVLNPESVLKRGYSIIYDDHHNIIKNVESLHKNSNITVKVSNGLIKAKVEEIKND